MVRGGRRQVGAASAATPPRTSRRSRPSASPLSRSTTTARRLPTRLLPRATGRTRNSCSCRTGGERAPARGADRPRDRARHGLVRHHDAADRDAADDQGSVPGRSGLAEQRLRDLERLNGSGTGRPGRPSMLPRSWPTTLGAGRRTWRRRSGDGGDQGQARAAAHTAEELATYLRRNAGQIITMMGGTGPASAFERLRQARSISRLQAVFEEASMRWTQAGAHLALQARTRAERRAGRCLPTSMARSGASPRPDRTGQRRLVCLDPMFAG